MIKEVLKNLFQKLFAPEELEPKIDHFEKAKEHLELAQKESHDILKIFSDYNEELFENYARIHRKILQSQQ